MTLSTAPILLKTKLHRPPLQTDFVQRPQLLHRLQQNIKCKLTIVVAPAGFGKSTLIASWLAAIEDANSAGKMCIRDRIEAL